MRITEIRRFFPEHVREFSSRHITWLVYSLFAIKVNYAIYNFVTKIHLLLRQCKLSLRYIKRWLFIFKDVNNVSYKLQQRINALYVATACAISNMKLTLSVVILHDEDWSVNVVISQWPLTVAAHDICERSLHWVVGVVWYLDQNK